MARMKTYTVFSSDTMGRDLVVMDEKGSKIENITELTIRGSVGEPMTLELTVIGVAVNAQAVVDSVTFLCPECDEFVMHDCTPHTLSGKRVEPDPNAQWTVP